MKEIIETPEDCKAIGCEKYPCDNVQLRDPKWDPTTMHDTLEEDCVFEVSELEEEEETEHVEGGHIEIAEGSYLAQVKKCGKCSGTGKVIIDEDYEGPVKATCTCCHNGYQIELVYNEQYIEDNLNK